jgi:hypothetical protein
MLVRVDTETWRTRHSRIRTLTPSENRSPMNRAGIILAIIFALMVVGGCVGILTQEGGFTSWETTP